jgi:hypothetical protein
MRFGRIGALLWRVAGGIGTGAQAELGSAVAFTTECRIGGESSQTGGALPRKALAYTEIPASADRAESKATARQAWLTARSSGVLAPVIVDLTNCGPAPCCLGGRAASISAIMASRTTLSFDLLADRARWLNPPDAERAARRPRLPRALEFMPMGGRAAPWSSIGSCRPIALRLPALFSCSSQFLSWPQRTIALHHRNPRGGRSALAGERS